jgi:Fic family protein
MQEKVLFEELDALKLKIDAYGKLSDEVLRKVEYKFRLDWNYYSNSMEGNTLTQAETRAVMVGNITVDGKSIKDVLEIKGHDEVIQALMQAGKGKKRLAEKLIKDIHKGIMHANDATEKAQIGQWKKVPNYIYNTRSERFDFTAPDDVPETMHALINKTNAALDRYFGHKKNAQHPVQIALDFHLDFVRIHPFYDGNGRTARILTNLILVSYGYPPFWIHKSEAHAYHEQIGEIQAYGATRDQFYANCGKSILRSLNMTLDAIGGLDISEA